MKTKFLIVSDIHEFEENVLEIVKKYSPDIVLDCGDHEKNFYSEKKIPWYFIYGNHENSEMLEKIRNKEVKIKNLNLIRPGDLVSINGINIAGFGGNYSKKTYNEIGKRKGNSYTHITKKNVKKMEDMAGKRKLVDILLMHESSKELWEETQNNFGQEVNSKVVKLFPNLKYVISGHYHVPNDKLICNEGYICHYEISLNTPENFNFLMLEGKNRRLSKLYFHNE